MFSQVFFEMSKELISMEKHGTLRSIDIIFFTHPDKLFLLNQSPLYL